MEIEERMKEMENVIEVKNLVKRYKEVVALDHFNLQIKKGEIFGLLGPNGSGKTTTINCILSLLEYDKGEIKVFGQEMKPYSYNLKKNIGVVMQNVAVFEELTVWENVDYFCGLYIPNRSERKKLVEEAIEFVGLEDYKKFYPKKLSGGLLRRLNIACGIAHKPKLIFFDEPTVAVDPQTRNRILEGIKKLNREGATIIYTSHYMEEVEQLCSKILIMDKGKNVAIGTKEELKKIIKNTETISVEVSEITLEEIEEVKKLPHVYKAKFDGVNLLINYSGGKYNLTTLLEHFQKNGIVFGEVFTKFPTLNDVFLEITGKELRD